MDSDIFKKPKLYHENNKLQQNDAREALKKFKKYFTWKEGENILDIGSGDGKATTLLLLPLLPHGIASLIGADKSKEMVLFAEKECKTSKVSYVNFDIEETDKDKVKDIFSAKGVDQGFDKIFSFHCLHWIKNSRQAIDNMYSLIKPGGQCLVMFAENGLDFDVWNAISSQGKWHSYFENEEAFDKKFPIPFSKNVKGEYSAMLMQRGFQMIECVRLTREKPFDFSKGQFRNTIESMDPLIQHIPKELQVCYMDDVVQMFKTMSLKKYGKPVFVYNVIMFFFSKPME